MQPPNAMQVGHGDGKPLAVFGCDEDIDIDGVNGLIALLIATTVANRLRASGEIGRKDISQGGHSWWCLAAVVSPQYSSPISLLAVNRLL
jgi:hypothetical protein